MEKAYIILVHKNPSQLVKLVEQLDDGKSTFFIHIDKNVDLEDFQSVVSYSSRLHIVPRERTSWGSFGLVKATLRAMEAVLNSHKTFDRIILLSGQDYPVKSNSYINSFFKTFDASIFIEYTTIPDYNRWPATGGLYRVRKYFLGLKVYQRYMAKAMNIGSRFLPFMRRKMPGGMKPYAGSQWWSIDDYTLKYILDYVKKNPVYTTFHKYTFAPDEIYFHTLLLNSTDPRILKSITNNNLMHTRWLHTSSSHPEVITKSCIDELISSDSLFARKFEQETDTEVFNLINRCCSQMDNLAVHQE